MRRPSILLAATLLLIPAAAPSVSAQQTARADSGPRFAPEPFWPKPLPDNWILGQVSGIAVDRNDHIWIVHRPATLLDDEKGAQQNPPATKCCAAAPPVLEFDSVCILLLSCCGPGSGYDLPNS